MAAVKAARDARNDWQTKTMASLESYLHEAVSAQGALATRRAEDLKKRGMVDFRRSSVADTILTAVKSLPTSAKVSCLFLSTDGIDEPPGRSGRTTPFTAAELPANVHIVFITPDGAIPRSSLFKGLKNPSTTAPDLAGAVAYARKMVTQPQSRGSYVTN